MATRTKATERRTARAAPATDRGEVTRRHILEVAAAGFAESGFAGTSLNDVIKQAGVTKGGFYFHFRSKGSLAVEVIRHKQEQWAGRVISASLQHATANERLMAVPRALCDLYEQDPAAKSISRLCMELSEDRTLAPELWRQFGTWIELTSSLVRASQQEGSIRDDVDADLVGEYLVTTFIGTECMADMASAGADMRERVERHIALCQTLFQPSTV